MIDPKLVSMIDDFLIKGFDVEYIGRELSQKGFLQQNINDSINYLSNAKRNPPISQYGPPQIPKAIKNKISLSSALITLLIILIIGATITFFITK